MINQVLAAATPLQDLYAPAKAIGGTNITLSTFVGPLVNDLLIVSGIVAFFVLIIAGFSFVSASGDKGKIEQAQNMLNYGIVGLVVVVIAFVVTRIISTVFGIKFF